MSHTARALILDANGFGWRAVISDSVFRGLLRLNKERIPPFLQKHSFVQKITQDRYATLGYVADWRQAFVQHASLDCDVCNICNLVEFNGYLRMIREYDLIVILHSAAGDSMEILNRVSSFFDRRRGPILMFLGNEYALMQEKISFIIRAEVEYICSQLPQETAFWLYEECNRSSILAVPHALNPVDYSPGVEVNRTIDIGFVGRLYHNTIGDRERSALIEYFNLGRGRAEGLRRDIRFTNLSKTEWAAFLQTCVGVIGAESGTYFLDRNGSAIRNAINYCNDHPFATFEEVIRNCFSDLPPHVNGKAISSRHFEPIGTKTCQILIEGHYNGVLTANKHYVSVKKDLSDIDDAIARFCDVEYRRSITEAAHSHVMGQHTYKHRVDSLLRLTGFEPK
jgi:hypothetical protein